MAKGEVLGGGSGSDMVRAIVVGRCVSLLLRRRNS